MRKIEIYANMLQFALSYIRNVQTHSFLRKGFDKSCLEEAELLHNVVIALDQSEFGESDLWFLNYQARRYLEEPENKVRCPNYNLHAACVAELFNMVPDAMKGRLLWGGPKVEHGYSDIFKITMFDFAHDI